MQQELLRPLLESPKSLQGLIRRTIWAPYSERMVIRLHKIKCPRRTIGIELCIDRLMTRAGASPGETQALNPRNAIAEPISSVCVNWIDNLPPAPK